MASSGNSHSHHVVAKPEKKHPMIEAFHHPIIEVVAHTISPLTAALLIWSVHKSTQLTALRGWFLARQALRHVHPAAPEITTHHNAAATHRTHHHHESHAHGKHDAHAKSTESHGHQKHSTDGKAHRSFHTFGASVNTMGALRSSRVHSYLRQRFPHQSNSLHRSFHSKPTVGAFAAASSSRVSHGAWSSRFQGANLTKAMANYAATTASGSYSPLGALRISSFATASAAAGGPEKVDDIEGVSTDALSASADAATQVSEHGPYFPKLLQLYEHSDAVFLAHHLPEIWTVRQFENAMMFVHETYGLPWFATIFCFTMCLRVLIMPINILLLRNSLRLKVISPKVKELTHEIAEAPTPAKKVHAAQALMDLFQKNKCSPISFDWIIPFGFPPFFLSFFAAVYKLSLSQPDMAYQGMLWFPDLVLTDPTFLMPILSSLTWLWSVEVGVLSKYRRSTWLPITTRLTAIAFIPMTATMPCGVLIFWVSSNVYAIIRTYVMRSNSIRRRLNIPLAEEIQSLQQPRTIE